MDGTVEFEGHLEKSPPFDRDIFGRLKRWHTRYCILKREENGVVALKYYEDYTTYNREGTCKGSILLQDCVEINKVEGQLFNRDFMISLRTKENSKHKGRVFLFRASNQVFQSHWYNSILKCMNKAPSGEAKENLEEDVSEDERRMFAPERPTELQTQTLKEKLAARIQVDEAIEVCQPPEPSYKEGGCSCQKNRRSSGYYTMDDRSSRTSQLSSGSDMSVYQLEDEQNPTKFGFSPVFEGPRVGPRKMTKAKSMGNLFDSFDTVSIKTSIHISDSTSMLTRPSLQERVDIILRRPSLGQTSSFDEQKADTFSFERNYDWKRPRPQSEPAGYPKSVTAEPPFSRRYPNVCSTETCGTKTAAESEDVCPRTFSSPGLKTQFSKIEEQESETPVAAAEETDPTTINRTCSDPILKTNKTKINFLMDL